MVLLFLNTGLRRGELFNLEWRDVDLERGMLTVSGAVSKSGKPRYISLNATALDTLKGWRAQTAGTGLVFENPHTGAAYDNVNKAWRAVLKDAEVTGFRWHDMRHDFASKLVMGGVDLYTVKELLGHSSFEMTQRYAHLSPEAKRRAVEVLTTPTTDSVDDIAAFTGKNPR